MPINSLGYSCIKKLKRDNLWHAYNEPINFYSVHLENFLKLWKLVTPLVPKLCKIVKFAKCIYKTITKVVSFPHSFARTWKSYFQIGLKIKVVYTKYSKHWPYTVAHTMECVCSKIYYSWLNAWFSFYFSSLHPAP